ncbi:SpoIIE family protein phosphatase [Haliea sp. E17]|uniref:SpoIIE family protein phosphatase n=1 Tax=Haliea sp. E17 TaxID=3401576 RepID=UPI003AAC0252
MNSLGTRLIVLLIGCAVLIFGAGMLLDYHLSRKEILERVVAESANEVNTVISDLENWLSGVEGATQFLARVLERQVVVEQDELRAMLRDVVANNSEIYGATIALNPALTADARGFAPYYYHRDGKIRYADLTTDAADYQNTQWFTLPLESGLALWSEPYFDHGGGEVNMTTYSVPVYRLQENGQRVPYAVVTADVRLSDLQKALDRLQYGPNAYGILVSRGGIVMSGRRPGNIMQHFSVAEGRPRAESGTLQQLFERALNGENVSTTVPCPEAEGQCTLRVGRLHTTGWPLILVYDQRQALAQLYAFTLKTALVSIGTILLVSLAMYLITARLTRPLKALSAAAEQIGKGELDFPLPQARGGDEIATLVRAFREMGGNLQTHIQELADAAANRSRLEGELSAAREIQMSMLPGGGEALHQEGRCSLWARVEPARTVGGDFYSWQQQGDCFWFAVGDVSDKGVPAALFMSRAISLLQQLTESTDDPCAALAALNELLYRDNPACMFVTLLLGRIDSQSGLLQYAVGGHPGPSLRHGQSVNSLAPASGPPLGLAPAQQFPPNQLVLEPGDCLAVFTDGVEEAFDGHGEMFGTERFNAALARVVRLPIQQAGQQLFATIADHATNIAQSDDIAIMLLRFWPAVSAAFTPGAQLVSRVGDWLQPQLSAWSITGDLAFEVMLLAEEIVTNIDKYAELQPGAEITLQLVLAGDVLAMEIRDPGYAFDPFVEARRAQLCSASTSARIGGLGVHLIEKFSDRQSYRRQDGQNILRVEKYVTCSGDTTGSDT